MDLLENMQIPPLHRRLATLVGLCLLMLAASGFIPEHPTDTRTQTDADLALAAGPSPTDELPLPAAADNNQPAESHEPSLDPRQQHRTTVKNGDNMAIIFADNGFSARTLHALTQTKHGKVLADIFLAPN